MQQSIEQVLAPLLQASDLDEAVGILLLEAAELGSPSDVHGAVGFLLPSESAIELCSTIFDAVKAKRGPKEAKRARLATTRTGAGSGGSGGTRTGAGSGGSGGAQNVASSLERLSWAREYKSQAERFERPYQHTLPEGTQLTLQQRPFDVEGFASSVWDSAIVLAKALERLGEGGVARASACELGAGCGLPGLVLAARGARVVLTDLPCNLPLLADNCRANAHAWSEPDAPVVSALKWGSQPPAECAQPFDLILGADLFYAHDAMPLLVDTLVALSGKLTTVWLAAGRNRQAADEFWPLAKEHFAVELVPPAELDPLYQLDSVNVWRLRLHGARGVER